MSDLTALRALDGPLHSANRMIAGGLDDLADRLSLVQILWASGKEAEAVALTNELRACFAELQQERVYVQFRWTVSLIGLTLAGTSGAYRSRTASARWSRWGCTLVTLLLGWWSVPWGPMRTLQALIANLRGGEDVTDLVLMQRYRTRRPGDVWPCPGCKRPMLNLVKRCLACGSPLR